MMLLSTMSQTQTPGLWLCLPAPTLGDPELSPVPITVSFSGMLQYSFSNFVVTTPEWTF